MEARTEGLWLDFNSGSDSARRVDIAIPNKEQPSFPAKPR